MRMTELKTPSEWLQTEKFRGIEILDPDGWRGKFAPSFDEPTTEDDFTMRLMESTCRWPQWIFDV